MLRNCLHNSLIIGVFTNILFWGGCFAYQTPYEIAATVSCNNELNRHFYINEYTAQFGKPYKEDGGALWFKVPSMELYGAQVKDLFVSVDVNYLFVGVVLNAPPEEVVEAIKASKLVPTIVFRRDKDTWVGADSRTIMRYNGKYTKIFCLSGAK